MAGYGNWVEAQPRADGAQVLTDRNGRPIAFNSPAAADVARRIQASNTAPIPLPQTPRNPTPEVLANFRTQLAAAQAARQAQQQQQAAQIGQSPIAARMRNASPQEQAQHQAWVAKRNAILDPGNVPVVQGVPGQGQGRARAPTAEEQAAADEPPAVVGGAQPQRSVVGVPLRSVRGGTLMMREGADPANLGQGDTWVATPAQAATKGGAVERSRTVKEGPGYNQEYIDSLQNAAIDANTKLDEAVSGLQADADKSSAVLSQKAADDQQTVADAASYLKEVQTKTEEWEQKSTAAQQEYKDSKVDPTRASGGLFDAIGVALGAFGAALAKTPNFAMEIMQNRINNDIRAQEKEIEVRGKTADNALARFERNLGNMTLAKQAYKIARREEGQTQLDLIGAKAKSRDVQAKVEEAKSLNMTKLAEDTEKYRIMVADDVTKSIQNVPGSPGRAAGNRAPTTDEVPLPKQTEPGGKGKGGASDQMLQNKLAVVNAGLSQAIAIQTEHEQQGRPGIIADEGGTFATEGVQKLVGMMDAAIPTIDMAQQAGTAPNESTMKQKQTGFKSNSGDQIAATLASNIQSLKTIKKAMEEGRNPYPDAVAQTTEPEE